MEAVITCDGSIKSLDILDEPFRTDTDLPGPPFKQPSRITGNQLGIPDVFQGNLAALQVGEPRVGPCPKDAEIDRQGLAHVIYIEQIDHSDPNGDLGRRSIRIGPYVRLHLWRWTGILLSGRIALSGRCAHAEDARRREDQRRNGDQETSDHSDFPREIIAYLWP